MRIFYRDRLSKDIVNDVEFPEGSNVGDLRKKIAEELNCNPHDLKLVYQSKILREDNTLLSDYANSKDTPIVYFHVKNNGSNQQENPTQQNASFPTQQNTSFSTQQTPSFSTQQNTSFPTQQNTSFSTQQNTSFPTQQNTYFSTQQTPSFPTQQTPSFPTQQNTSFPTQQTPSFPTQQNTSNLTHNFQNIHDQSMYPEIGFLQFDPNFEILERNSYQYANEINRIVEMGYDFETARKAYVIARGKLNNVMELLTSEYYSIDELYAEHMTIRTSLQSPVTMTRNSIPQATIQMNDDKIIVGIVENGNDTELDYLIELFNNLAPGDQRTIHHLMHQGQDFRNIMSCLQGCDFDMRRAVGILQKD